MHLKSIQLRNKRSKSSINQQKNRYEQIQNWQNTLISLSKVLNTLQDDTIKRYNTQTNRYQLQNSSINQSKGPVNLSNSLIQSKKLIQTRYTFKHKNKSTNNKYKQDKQFQPEPWFNQFQQLNTKQTKQNKNYRSKSFHNNYTSKNSNKIYSTTNGVHNLSSNHQSHLHISSRNCTQNQQNQKLLTQNFNYTNEQKARVSLQYLIHQKKHKKIQKILKYKAHFIDKTALKHQKINQHSQYLVQTLKKLSLDNLLATSIAEFGQGVKKRNSINIHNNVKLNSFMPTQKTPKLQHKQQKSSSCCQLLPSTKQQIKLIRKRSKPKCTVRRFEPQFQNQQTNKQINNYKVSFKPKRTWIFDKKPTSCSQKQLKPQHIHTTPKKFNKIQTITNHFLKINHLKI